MNALEVHGEHEFLEWIETLREGQINVSDLRVEAFVKGYSSFWCELWRFGSEKAALSMTWKSLDLSRLTYFGSLARAGSTPCNRHFCTKRTNTP